MTVAFSEYSHINVFIIIIYLLFLYLLYFIFLCS